jgi:hypothetical protein
MDTANIVTKAWSVIDPITDTMNISVIKIIINRTGLQLLRHYGQTLHTSVPRILDPWAPWLHGHRSHHGQQENSSHQAIIAITYLAALETIMDTIDIRIIQHPTIAVSAKFNSE